MPDLNKVDIIFPKKSFLQELQKRYGIQINKIEPPEFISYTSKKAILRTENKALFLKQKPHYCADQHQRNLSARFQEILSRKLNFVPQIKKTKDGKFYFKYEERFYFLTKFIQGRAYNGSVEDVLKGCKALYKFVNESKKIGDKIKLKNKKESYEVLNIFNLIQEEGDNFKEEVNLINEVINQLKREYKKNQNEVKTKKILCHGDFSPFNLIFNKEKIVAINDFDNAAVYPWIHDLAEYLVTSSLINYKGKLTNLKKPVFDSFYSPHFEKILNFYKTNFNLNKTEVNLLSIIVDIIWLEILLLAVIKEDYHISDLDVAINKIKNKNNKQAVFEVWGGL